MHLQKAHAFDSIGALEPRLPVVFIFLRGSGFCPEKCGERFIKSLFFYFHEKHMLT
jgi:hypothetical protein